MSDDGSLSIEWYGQAMFRIEGGGATVVLDPVGPHAGYEFQPFPADIVLVTHEHADHNYVEGITGSPKIIREGSGVSTIGGFDFRGRTTYHDASGGAERGSNTIYDWKQAGFRLAHFGDLGEIPGDDLLEGLEGLDIMMVPVGGVYTIDGGQAAELVNKLMPRLVLPMHFGTSRVVFPLEPTDKFEKALEGRVKKVSERPAVITRRNLPEPTEAWILPYE